MKPNIHITNNFTISILLLLCVCFDVSAEKIGFVDMETLINNSPQINNARKTINTEFALQYEDIENKESDLEVLENRITKNGAIMSIEELANLQERARILERQVRRSKEDLKDSISIRNNLILSTIQKELKQVVEQYAIDNNYDAILINEILYVSERMDITKEILDVLKESNTNGN